MFLSENFGQLWEELSELNEAKADTEKRFKVVMIVDDNEYTYGTYDSRDRANEVAMLVRDERDVETYVEEI